MDNKKSIYEKAETLMKAALRKYSKGDLYGAEKDREAANMLYDSVKDEEAAEIEKNNMLYGESRNFGIIKRIIESNTAGLNEDKGKRAAYREIVSAIKKDKNLAEQFKLFDAIENPHNVKDAKTYVNEALSMVKLSNKNLKESNNSLINVIRKHNLNEMIEINDEDLAMYESVDYVIRNKKGFSNLSDYTNSLTNISEYVTSHNSDEIKESAFTVYENKLSEIESKLENELNDDERELLETITNTQDKEKLFNEKKEQALTQLNALLETTGDDYINEAIESVMKKEFDENNIYTDIAEFIEITNIVNG